MSSKQHGKRSSSQQKKNTSFTSENDCTVVKLLDPVAVKREMKDQNHQLDQLVQKLEEFNEKFNKMAESRGMRVQTDPIQHLITEYHEKFDRKRRRSCLNIKK